MKIQAIIVNGKMYKQVASTDFKCDNCPMTNNHFGSRCCPMDGFNWQEVPEITDKEIEDYLAVHRFITHTQRFDVTKAMDWYKKQLKQRLEE